MSMVLEQIKSKIKALPYEERLSLWVDLRNEFDPPDEEDEDEVSVEEAWNEEIAARVREVEEGTVRLIPIEESERRIDEFFAERGMTRIRISS